VVRDAGADRYGVVDGRATRHEHIEPLARQLLDEPRKPGEVAIGEPRDDDERLALDVPQLTQSLTQVFQSGIGLTDIGQPADAGGGRGALRTRVSRAEDHDAGEEGEKGATRRRHDGRLYPMRRTPAVRSVMARS